MKPELVLVCTEQNDLYSVLTSNGTEIKRFDLPESALKAVPEGSSVLLLCDTYPEVAQEIDPALMMIAAEKSLKLLVEYPGAVPGYELHGPHQINWERGVVASEQFEPALPELRILEIHDCHYMVTQASDPSLVVARVAGFDKAVYGLPEEVFPVLFKYPEKDIWVSTTGLSNFVTARYGPTKDWAAIWEHILQTMDPNGRKYRISYTPLVRARYGKEEQLPEDVERLVFEDAVQWQYDSRLLIHPDRKPEIDELLLKGGEIIPVPGGKEPIGDGSLGFLEGYEARIKTTGDQNQRLPIRADCSAESAMVFALGAKIRKQERDGETAGNILDYVYSREGMLRGQRGDPGHPAFGHIAWGIVAPAWEVANYGDDNARVLLATIVAGAALESDQWDQPVLECIMANLRTTGPSGFRGGRIDMKPLEENGWKHYHDTDRTFFSPHYESYMWACYLWAYDKTGYEEFLTVPRTAIEKMMEVYPDGWLWKDSIDRARMLLCLSWLIRVDDTPVHRQWLKKISDDLLKNQKNCGAIQEMIVLSGAGHFVAPESNEAYGTREIPLIQENGDTATDLLYCLGFALLGLHEAVAATGDSELKTAEDKLAEYICRIQNRSEEITYLNGSWYRAFDFGRWEPWAGSGDIGWGAWCVEAGWGQAWSAAILGLRQMEESVWDFTSESRIAEKMDKARARMSMNDGSPYTR